MAEPVPAIVRRALRLVEARQPDASRAMATALAGLRLEIAIDGRLLLESSGGRLVERAVATADRRAELRLRADRAAIVSLLRGETTLLRSIRAGAIDLAGTTAALARGLEAFEHFVGALLRTDDADDLRRSLER